VIGDKSLVRALLDRDADAASHVVLRVAGDVDVMDASFGAFVLGALDHDQSPSTSSLAALRGPSYGVAGGSGEANWLPSGP